MKKIHTTWDGERRYSSYSFLTLTLDGVSGQLQALDELLPLGKDPWYPLDRRLGGPQSWLGHRGQRKNPLPLPGIELWLPSLQLPGHPVCSQTLYWLSYQKNTQKICVHKMTVLGLMEMVDHLVQLEWKFNLIDRYSRCYLIWLVIRMLIYRKRFLRTDPYHQNALSFVTYWNHILSYKNQNLY
jgi:hypothetical protein